MTEKKGKNYMLILLLTKVTSVNAFLIIYADSKCRN